MDFDFRVLVEHGGLSLKCGIGLLVVDQGVCNGTTLVVVTDHTPQVRSISVKWLPAIVACVFCTVYVACAVRGVLS